MTWVAAAVAGGSALYSGIQGNQDRQRARGSEGRVVREANERYAERAPFRQIGRERLMTPGRQDFSADYTGGPQYRAVNDPLYAQATNTQSRSLADLQNGPNRLAMVTQAMADFDATDAPRRAQGVRRIGQNAATLGRVGMEGVGTEIGNFELAAEGERTRAQNAMIRDAVEGTQADRYRTAGLAGEIASDAYGRGADERGYGDSLSLADIERRVERRDRERGAASTAFNEGMDMTRLGIGDTPDAANRWQANNQNARADANFAAAGEAAGSLGSILARRSRRPVPPATPTR